MSETRAITVLLGDDLLALNRAVGIVRRRNLGVESVTLGPSGLPGVSRLTLLVSGDAAAITRMVNHFRKVVGVREAVLHDADACVLRELALIRVRISRARHAELLDTLALYGAEVVDESPHELFAEAAGPAPFLQSLVRALEPFGVLDVARSGTVALPRTAPAEAAAPAAASPPRPLAAIPA